jgi:hypothetical protein
MGKQAVAKVEDNLPQERPSWMGDTARGNESVSADDMAIPRLSIIQDLSPQHKEGKSEYIEGARPKMVFNTATQSLYPDGVLIVPVLFRKEWVIWKDIDEGGGFRGAFNSESEAKRNLAELEDAAQCEIVDTHQHFVLAVDPSVPASEMDDPRNIQQAVVSMSKSQMKVSRQWNTIISSAGGDRFERLYTLSVVDDKNAAGQEYYNWKVTQKGYVTEGMFKLAEQMYEAVKSGAMDVKRDDATPSTEYEEGEVMDHEEF